jgi:uncharacterized repeat protein (TIGR01451 family)
MRHRLAALGIAGTVLLGAGSSMAQALRRDVDRSPVSTLSGIPFPQVVGPTFITQSTATTITPLNSFSCSGSGANTDSSYYRAFTLSAFNPPLDQQEFLVQSVTFGIEAAVGPGNGRAQPATVRIYSSTTNPPTTASLTLLSTENVSIDDQAGTLLTVPLSTTPLLTVATDILVVEVFTPNGAATGSSLIIGSNGLGQAGPSFIKAADCAIGEITSLSATFPDMHIVMRVDGNSQGQGADLSITTSNGKDGYFPGETLTYTIAAENLGPVATAGAAVTGSFPADLTDVSWTCAASAGSSCASPSGSGALSTTVDLLPLGVASFTVTATASPTAAGSITHTATVAPPSGVADPVPGNNSATDTDARVGGSFFTLSPCRLLDTRDAVGEFGGPALAASASRSVNVAGHCGVPDYATAVALNLTATAPTAAGFLQVFPTGGVAPQVSVVNYSAGQTRASNGVYALGTSGRLDLRCGQATGTTHAIVDVSGYFIE